MMIGSLAFVTSRNDLRFEPLTGVGSALVVCGLAAFAVNLVVNGRPVEEASAPPDGVAAAR